MGMHWMIIRTPIYGTFEGMILTQLIFTLPYTVFMLSAVFKNYDLDYEDQARSLGAGRADIFFYVTLPAMKNGIMVAALYTFSVSWSQYLVIMMMGNPSIKTLPLTLFAMIGGSEDPSLSAVLSVIFILPAMVMLILSAWVFTQKDGKPSK